MGIRREILSARPCPTFNIMRGVVTATATAESILADSTLRTPCLRFPPGIAHCLRLMASAHPGAAALTAFRAST